MSHIEHSYLDELNFFIKEEKYNDFCECFNSVVQVNPKKSLIATQLVYSDYKADLINTEMLKSSHLGRSARQIAALSSVDLEPDVLSAPEVLTVKKQCRVLILQGASDKSYSAGDLGTLISPGKVKRRVKVRLDRGDDVYIYDHDWPYYDRLLKSHCVWQIPICLAYARSVHELDIYSRRIVFPEIYIDPDNFGGTAEQFCLALQHVENPSELSLKRPLRVTDLKDKLVSINNTSVIEP